MLGHHHIIQYSIHSMCPFHRWMMVLVHPPPHEAAQGLGSGDRGDPA